MFYGRTSDEELGLWQASVNFEDKREPFAFPFPAHESDDGFSSSLYGGCRFDARWNGRCEGIY